MSDLISRQAAIEAVRLATKSKISLGRGDVLDILYSIPPAVCDDCIWAVCNYNKVDWDEPPMEGDNNEKRKRHD